MLCPRSARGLQVVVSGDKHLSGEMAAHHGAQLIAAAIKKNGKVASLSGHGNAPAPSARQPWAPRLSAWVRQRGGARPSRHAFTAAKKSFCVSMADVATPSPAPRAHAPHATHVPGLLTTGWGVCAQANVILATGASQFEVRKLSMRSPFRSTPRLVDFLPRPCVHAHCSFWGTRPGAALKRQSKASSVALHRPCPACPSPACPSPFPPPLDLRERCIREGAQARAARLLLAADCSWLTTRLAQPRRCLPCRCWRSCSWLKAWTGAK